MDNRFENRKMLVEGGERVKSKQINRHASVSCVVEVALSGAESVV